LPIRITSKTEKWKTFFRTYLSKLELSLFTFERNLKLGAGSLELGAGNWELGAESRELGTGNRALKA